MKIKSAEPLYDVLNRTFIAATSPLTASQLMEIGDVRERAVERYGKDIQTTTNKLSDMLGFMWRRSVIQRYDAIDATTKARYAYGKKELQAAAVLTAISPPVRFTTTAGKPRFTITESDDSVTIEFEQVTFTVRTK
jgi:hypothetical protein